MKYLVNIFILSSILALAPAKAQVMASSETPHTISLSGKASDVGGVELTWQSQQVVDNRTFSIEYSKDGLNFQVIGNSKYSDGRPSLAHLYQDPQPGTGLNFYRLKYTEKDGSQTYSHIVSVLVTDKYDSK